MRAKPRDCNGQCSCLERICPSAALMPSTGRPTAMRGLQTGIVCVLVLLQAAWATFFVPLPPRAPRAYTQRQCSAVAISGPLVEHPTARDAVKTTLDATGILAFVSGNRAMNPMVLNFALSVACLARPFPFLMVPLDSAGRTELAELGGLFPVLRDPQAERRFSSVESLDGCVTTAKEANPEVSTAVDRCRCRAASFRCATAGLRVSSSHVQPPEGRPPIPCPLLQKAPVPRHVAAQVAHRAAHFRRAGQRRSRAAVAGDPRGHPRGHPAPPLDPSARALVRPRHRPVPQPPVVHGAWPARLRVQMWLRVQLQDCVIRCPPQRAYAGPRAPHQTRGRFAHSSSSKQPALPPHPPTAAAAGGSASVRRRHAGGDVRPGPVWRPRRRRRGRRRQQRAHTIDRRVWLRSTSSARQPSDRRCWRADAAPHRVECPPVPYVAQPRAPLQHGSGAAAAVSIDATACGGCWRAGSCWLAEWY